MMEAAEPGTQRFYVDIETGSPFEYKFIVDGEWRVDSNAPCVTASLGAYPVVNNVILVETPPVSPRLWGSTLLI